MILLRIDLNNKSWELEGISPNLIHDYLGGSSLSARLLYDLVTPDLEPLSPEAPLLFMTGPLVGTHGPATGRYVICAKSPATGLWGESNIGGFWGTELRRVGIDGVLLTGRASAPVHIWITDRDSLQVEISSADHLWGRDTYDTQKNIHEELSVGKVSTACIGRAGEEMIPFASVMCDHGRMAGRSGMGAVMGSKNLKAITVQGHGKVLPFDVERFKKIRSETNRKLTKDAFTTVARDLGTSGVADYLDYIAEMPKKYFQEGGQIDDLKTSGAEMAETILVGISACHGCVIACGRVVDYGDQQKRKGPEYETMVGFGPNLGINDPVFTSQMGEICDHYGLDTISMSNIIGLVYRLYEKKIISEKDLDGLKPVWGNPAPVPKLIKLTLEKRGIGRYLAKGARETARFFGVEDEAIQVKGLEVPYHDPRGASGIALSYMTSPRGACHNQSDFFLADLGQVEQSLHMEMHDRHAGVEKARDVASHQNWRTVFNSLVICFFANISPANVVEFINAGLGYDWSIDDMLKAGERAWNLKRVINNRLGVNSTNDRLPKAMLKTYRDDKAEEFSKVPDYQEMLQAYYHARGWDPSTGIPQKSKLIELGLEFTIPDLY